MIQQSEELLASELGIFPKKREKEKAKEEERTNERRNESIKEQKMNE